MIVFCDGMPRSASTWSFNVVVNVLRQLEPTSHIYAEYRDNFTGLLDSLEPEYVHVVVKSHQLDHIARVLLRIGAAKAIYTKRAPTDAVASYMKMFGQSFDEALKAIQESLRLEEFHQSTRGCCVIHYNDIVETPRKAIEKIGSYLGLDVPGPIVDEVSHRTSLQRMKEVSDQLDKRPSTSMVESGGLLYDRETLLHKSHIRDGRTGYGSDLLSAEQQNRIREMLAEFPGSSDS